MSRNFKNILRLRPTARGVERRKNLTKEVLKDSTPIPNPLEYKDIDDEFKRWVEEDLSMSYDGERLPTITLFSNQRFSEYMQSWANVDSKKNLLLNFKTVTRENNPKSGTIVGNSKNIPGEPTFLMKRVEAYDNAGRKYYKEYRVKQPFAIDLIYSVNIVVSKYELLNEFNQMVNEKFKAIDCYIRPKGHFIPMKLEDISDESEYSIDNRQYYSQTYNIRVMGYIMPADSFSVEEVPVLKFVGFEGHDKDGSYVDIEEKPCNYRPKSDFAYEPLVLTVHLDNCSNTIKFNMDTDFRVIGITTENVREYKIFINDTQVELVDSYLIKNGDEVRIKGVRRYKLSDECVIRIDGYNPSEVFNIEKEPADVKSTDIS